MTGHCFGTMHVPHFAHIVNHAVGCFEATRHAIDVLPPAQREWDKATILAQDPGYRRFLALACNQTETTVEQVLQAAVSDTRFRRAMQSGLDELASMDDAGDLRFHSLSPYVLVRLLHPELVIETGVASGKSSALILLALAHNKNGRLVSIDLPKQPGALLADGARTHTGGRPVGWLVPAHLRQRWDLRLGDARELLPQALRQGTPDLFLHDSLHTETHVTFELDQVLATSCPVLGVDDIDTGAGLALEAALQRHGGSAQAYREWAVWRR
jgi:hypothetical protein